MFGSAIKYSVLTKRVINLQGGPKNGTKFLYANNFIKY